MERKKELCSAYGTKRRNGKGRDYIENSCNCFVASNHMVMYTGNIQRAKKWNKIKYIWKNKKKKIEIFISERMNDSNRKSGKNKIKK